MTEPTLQERAAALLAEKNEQEAKKLAAAVATALSGDADGWGPTDFVKMTEGEYRIRMGNRGRRSTLVLTTTDGIEVTCDVYEDGKPSRLLSDGIDVTNLGDYGKLLKSQGISPVTPLAMRAMKAHDFDLANPELTYARDLKERVDAFVAVFGGPNAWSSADIADISEPDYSVDVPIATLTTVDGDELQVMYLKKTHKPEHVSFQGQLCDYFHRYGEGIPQTRLTALARKAYASADHHAREVKEATDKLFAAMPGRAAAAGTGWQADDFIFTGNSTASALTPGRRTYEARTSDYDPLSVTFSEFGVTIIRYRDKMVNNIADFGDLIEPGRDSELAKRAYAALEKRNANLKSFADERISNVLEALDAEAGNAAGGRLRGWKSTDFASITYTTSTSSGAGYEVILQDGTRCRLVTVGDTPFALYNSRHADISNLADYPAACQAEAEAASKKEQGAGETEIKKNGKGRKL